MYSSSTPATLRQLEIRVVSGCLLLAQLAIGLEQELVTRQTEVRVASGEPWLTVYGPGVSASPSGVHPEMLLPREVLTVERLAKWIPLNDKLDGLAWAVARTTEDVSEVRVLVATSLVEGLHRRLPYQQSKFPDVKKPVTSRILNAGRAAAGLQADAEGLVRKKVTDTIVFFTEVSFRARATDIVAEVCAAVPEIAESVADLPGRQSSARNEMAHQRPPDEEKDPLEIRYLRWKVIANVTPWLLRGLLLLRAGIEPNVLHDRYLAYRRFAFFRANTAKHVKELGWELPLST